MAPTRSRESLPCSATDSLTSNRPALLRFLVVTHDQGEALGMAERIAVMDHGRVVQLGTPQELYECPGNRFVADFIGVMKLFRGVDAAGGIEVPGIGLLCGDAGRLELGSQALLAVRPEKVRVDVASPAGNMQNCIAGPRGNNCGHRLFWAGPKRPYPHRRTGDNAHRQGWQ